MRTDGGSQASLLILTVRVGPKCVLLEGFTVFLIKIIFQRKFRLHLLFPVYPKILKTSNILHFFAIVGKVATIAKLNKMPLKPARKDKDTFS